MKFKYLIIFISLFVLSSCDQQNINQSKKSLNIIGKKYKNSGFTLVYNDSLNIKKLDERSLSIYQNTLKKKSFVKITNPINKKSIIAEVISNRVDFSKYPLSCHYFIFLID